MPMKMPRPYINGRGSTHQRKLGVNTILGSELFKFFHGGVGLDFF